MKRLFDWFFGLVFFVGFLTATYKELSKSKYYRELQDLKSNSHKSLKNIKNIISK